MLRPSRPAAAVAALALPVLLACAGCTSAADVGSENTDLMHPQVAGAPIGFDDLVPGTDVTSQYAHATFSSDPGCSAQVSDYAGLAASLPNYLFTYETCAAGLTASVYVDFDVPVHALQFKGVGVNNATRVATLRVITTEGVETVEMTGQGDPTTPVLVDLSRYEHVLRLEIVDVSDPYGMGFDDFAFVAEDQEADDTPRHP